MAGMLRRTIKHRFNRRRNSPANRPQLTSPIGITSMSVADSTLTVVFNQAVTLKGVPQYEVDVVGAEPVSATLVNPMTLEIVYSVSIGLATTVTIPYDGLAVRNASGGFVAPTNRAIAA